MYCNVWNHCWLINTNSRRNSTRAYFVSQRRRCWDHEHSHSVRWSRSLKPLGKKRTSRSTTWRLHKVNASWLLCRSRVLLGFIWTRSTWYKHGFVLYFEHLHICNAICDCVGDNWNCGYLKQTYGNHEMALWSKNY